MKLQIQKENVKTKKNYDWHQKIDVNEFSKDYVDFLNEAGWILEKKLPSNVNNYSDLLEDTDWKSAHPNLTVLKHYRRDLDALS